MRNLFRVPLQQGLLLAAALGVLGGTAVFPAAATEGRGGTELLRQMAELWQDATYPSAPHPPSPELREKIAARVVESVRQLRKIEASVRPARQLLKEGEFTALEDHFRDLRERREAGKLHESTFFFAWWNAFDSEDPERREPHDRWIAEYPDSGLAWAARGSYWTEVGWKARGGAFASKTSAAQLAGMRNAFAKASTDFQRAMELEPQLLVPYHEMINIARTGRARGDATGATWLRRAIAVDPHTFVVRNALMGSLRPRWGGNYAVMRRFAQKSLAHADKNPDLHILGGAEAADRADQQRRGKNFSAAIALYSEALAYGPYSNWHKRRGRCHESLEQYPAAIADYGQALALARDPIDLWFARSRVHRKMGNYAAALDDLDQLLWRDPGNNYAYRKRAYTYRKMGNYAAALSDLDRVLEHDPNDHDAYEARSRVYLESGDLENARRELDRALALAPNHADHWLYMGWFHHVKESDFLSAQNAYRRYTELRPNDAEGWFWLSQTLDKTEHPDTRAAIVRYLQVVDRGDPAQRERVEFFENLLAGGF